MVNAFGFSANGEVIYRIQDNAYEALWINPIRAERPDASTLALRIHLDGERELLYVRALKGNAVTVRFHCARRA
jgi:hypothetical protein